MLETPQIVTTAARRAAVVRFTIPREKIQEVMGPAMGELTATIAEQGIAATGPPFSHHLRLDPKVFDFEVGVPTAEKVTPAGRVEVGELPAARVARTVYRGPYEGLGDAWRKFNGWIAENGHTPAPDLWESYVAGPESSPDPATWQTELNRPLTSGGG